jgi:death-on-curing protein
VQIETALAAHAEQLTVHGGREGLRDLGLLEGTMMRPKTKHDYGVSDVSILAAAYGFGIARNDPFVDGNKRMALVMMETFIGLNGFQFKSGNLQVAAMILELAAGEVSEDDLAVWISSDIEPFRVGE